jgi:hypothetical protein
MSDNDKKLYVVDLLYSLNPTKSDALRFKSCPVKSVVLSGPTTSYVWKRIVSQSLSLGLEQETMHRQETGQTTIIINQGSSVISPTPQFQRFWLERHASFEGGNRQSQHSNGKSYTYRAGVGDRFWLRVAQAPCPIIQWEYWCSLERKCTIEWIQLEQTFTRSQINKKSITWLSRRWWQDPRPMGGGGQVY